MPQFACALSAFVEGRNTKVQGAAEEVLKSIKMEIEEKGSRLSITQGGKYGDCVMQVSGREVSGVQQEKEGVGLATSVETLGEDLMARTQQLGSIEKARKKKCDVRFSFAKKKRVFQKTYMRVGVRKLLRIGLVLARWQQQTRKSRCRYRSSWKKKFGGWGGSIQHEQMEKGTTDGMEERDL